MPARKRSGTRTTGARTRSVNTLPYVDRYEYLSNAEIASKIAGLRAGTLNQADGLSDEDWKNLQGTNPDAIRVEAQPATYGAFSVSFKTEKPPWDDVRVRGAVSTAIDRLKWSQTVFGRGRGAGRACPLESDSRMMS